MSDPYGQANALLEIESELGDVFLLSGTEYPCVIGSRSDTSELGNGGYATGAALEIVCRAALFATPPTTADVLTINNKLHRIDSIMLSPCGSLLVLTCDDANRDA